MDHNEVIKALSVNICEKQESLSSDVLEHLASCKTCFDALAAISEIMKIDTSGWYPTIVGSLPCIGLEDELDRYATMDPKHLISENPIVAHHLWQCGDCAERYRNAKNIIKADTEGVWEPEIGFPVYQAGIWKKIKEKVFEIIGEIQVVVQNEVITFRELQDNLLDHSFYLAPTGGVRSCTTRDAGAVGREVYFTVSPPNVESPLKIRFLPEADDYITIIIEVDSSPGTKSVMALYETTPQRTLVEVRSLSRNTSSVRFEHLFPKRYSLEIRGPFGIAYIPLKLQTGLAG